jgi:hypothetical protein
VLNEYAKPSEVSVGAGEDHGPRGGTCRGGVMVEHPDTFFREGVDVRRVDLGAIASDVAEALQKSSD